jgi:hypothetical protein
LTYTAGTDNWISGGTLQVDIPSGWPDAQTADNTVTGYSTVSFSGTGAGSLTVVNSGRSLLVTVTSLAGGEQIFIVYGDTTVDVGAAVLVPAANPYTFTTNSDPQLDGPLPLASQPVVTVN